ncbi:Holo-(acyl-carrier-protein) synthase [[Clostridium] ultunense Esp]|uniref:holo-ACP synthase n=1 Tax=Thermicanus aegyptius TaxID=94009 RepID=UPI0002B6EEA0|nr:holo-ACP synthase [Thermicanus aegyptius]CCQ96320.1 Holo-(acyl-carrier-protein) synthase [[Clostridium] ultunense Esp]
MIIGIGTDMVEIERVRGVIHRNKRFLDRILTVGELAFLPSSAERRAEYVAGRFAAKEAFAKAMGTGIGGSLSWKDLSVIAGEHGKPMILLQSRRFQEGEWTRRKIHVSITHERSMALAFVIIEE